MIPGLVTLVASLLIVAAFAGPVAVVASLASRRPAPPTPRPMAFRWSAVELILLVAAFLVFESMALSIVLTPPLRESLVPPPFIADLATTPVTPCTTAAFGGAVSAHAVGRYERAVQVAGLWSRILSAACVTALVAWWLRARGNPRRRSRPDVARTVALGVFAWAVLAPLILAVNVLAGAASKRFDVTPDVHPLATIGADPNLTIVFLFSACVATPLVEELLVRGILLPWAARGLIRSVILFLPAAMLSVLGTPGLRLGPLTFFGVLVLGFWALLHFGPKREGTRTRVAAVYASSVLFAAAHTSVWPTPVPLFVFGLGLGFLALRTGGITASVIVHGLLNAVSATYVLRGGPM